MIVRERLEAYRRKKRREKIMESIKNTVRKAFVWNRNGGTEKLVEESTEEKVRLYDVFSENLCVLKGLTGPPILSDVSLIFFDVSRIFVFFDRYTIASRCTYTQDKH